MKDYILGNCKCFLEDRDRVKSVFRWDNETLHLACAGLFMLKGRRVDVQTLTACKDLLKNSVSAFSSFISSCRVVVVAMLAVDDNPQQLLNNGLQVYELLRKNFGASDYLPLAAMTIAQISPAQQYGAVAARAHVLYKRMSKEHPFITSQEDSVFCAHLALLNETDDELIAEMEQCYARLKPSFSSHNAVQSLSHALMLCEGTVEEKCANTLALYGKFKDAGRKFGADYELPMLGLLATSSTDLDGCVQDVIEIDTWLSEQKGFGFFSSITREQRLMYAGMLAQADGVGASTVQTAAVNSAMMRLLAQQVAMYVVVFS